MYIYIFVMYIMYVMCIMYIYIHTDPGVDQWIQFMLVG